MTVHTAATVLVTGATGTVGREAVRRLVTGDLAGPRTLAGTFHGVAAVFPVWPFDQPDGVEAVLAHAGDARVVADRAAADFAREAL